MNQSGYSYNGYDPVQQQMQGLQQQIAQLSGQMGQLVPSRAPQSAPEAVVEDWFSFVFRGTIPANSTTILTQLNDATGHFDLVFVTGIKEGNYLLRIREGEQGKFLTANGEFIEDRNFVGTAQRPYFVKGRRRFRANSTIIIELADTSGADNDIEFCMHGIKVSIV
jgi:hypothetical protein